MLPLREADCFFNFIWKLKKTTKYPDHPVNPVCPACPACPMESVFVFYSIGVEYEVHSSGVAPEDGTGINSVCPVASGNGTGV